VPLLVSAIEQANSAVHAAGKSDPALRKAGIALATALVAGRRAVIACIGDAAIYRLRGGALERLDAGPADAPAPKGRASVPPRARTAKAPVPRRAALGQKKTIEVETSIVALQPSDTLLLCTPRFRAALPLAETSAALVASTDADAAASELAVRAGDAMDGLALVITIPPLEG
jgi:serine/threonine protein phosphatase PrpC